MLKNLTNPEKFILIGIPIIFVLGSLMHFSYEFTNENIIIGLLTPVNESVWEHTKLGIIPLLLWWGLYYIFNRKKYNIEKNKWFTSFLISFLISIITIPMLFYFYTEAFGIENVFIDILIYFLSILLGQTLGLHFYKYSNGINYKICVLISIVILILYGILTIIPPKLPIFKDGNTSTYGIINKLK